MTSSGSQALCCLRSMVGPWKSGLSVEALCPEPTHSAALPTHSDWGNLTTNEQCRLDSRIREPHCSGTSRTFFPNFQTRFGKLSIMENDANGFSFHISFQFFFQTIPLRYLISENILLILKDLNFEKK